MRRTLTMLAVALSGAALLTGGVNGSPARNPDERACERVWKVAFGVEAPPQCRKQAVAMRGTGAP